MVNRQCKKILMMQHHSLWKNLALSSAKHKMSFAYNQIFSPYSSLSWHMYICCKQLYVSRAFTLELYIAHFLGYLENLQTFPQSLLKFNIFFSISTKWKTNIFFIEMYPVLSSAKIVTIYVCLLCKIFAWKSDCVKSWQISRLHVLTQILIKFQLQYHDWGSTFKSA